MEPQNSPTPQTEEEKRIQEEKYANALVQMANLDMTMQARQQSKQKYFLSKKKLFWIGFMIISTILSLLVTPLNPFDSPSGSNSNSLSQTTQNLIDTTQELQDANN